MTITTDKTTGLIIVIVIVAIIVLVYIRRHFKAIVLPNVFLVTGAVKSGKTLLSVHLAIKQYKKNLRSYYLKKIFLSPIGLFDADKLPPVLYSNIPLAKTKYNPLTMEIVRREVRIPDKSVVLIDESSLFADSMLFNDINVNNQLQLFTKLFAHYSHGGTLIFDTQSIKDNHFSIKRCLGSYLYIYQRIKLPFISILKVREMISIDDDAVQNNISEDLELTLRKVIIFNSTYRKYDCYALSSFTDFLPFECDYDTPLLRYDDDLKVYRIVSFQTYGKVLNDIMEKHEKEVEEEEKRLQELEIKEGENNEGEN